jgi:cytochrome c-type biogenesis protein CcmH/NrfG
MGKKTDALDYAKKTISMDFGNFTSWHVLGIVNAFAKDWDAAQAAYKQALKIDGRN